MLLSTLMPLCGSATAVRGGAGAVRPRPFDLVFPADSATARACGPTLKWEPAGRIESVRLAFDDAKHDHVSIPDRHGLDMAGRITVSVWLQSQVPQSGAFRFIAGRHVAYLLPLDHREGHAAGGRPGSATSPCDWKLGAEDPLTAGIFYRGTESCVVYWGGRGKIVSESGEAVRLPLAGGFQGVDASGWTDEGAAWAAVMKSGREADYLAFARLSCSHEVPGRAAYPGQGRRPRRGADPSTRRRSLRTSCPRQPKTY